MMEKPFLSICIPTYNRLSILKYNLEHVMTYDGDDVEFVVTDDCSTDGTREYLQEIKDSRFRYVINEPNLGAARNFIAAFFNGNGKYVMYCNDRDLILAEQIPRLIQMLKEDEYAYVMTCNDSTERSGHVFKYDKGFKALMAIPIEAHNTGNIYNGDLLRKYFRAEEFYSYADTTFGEKFVSRALITKEKMATFDYATYRNGGSLGDKQRLVSGHVLNGRVRADEDFYFHPKQSWYMVQSVWRQVFDEHLMNLDAEQTNQYIQYLMDFMIGRIPDYKLYRNMKEYRQHYNLSEHQITTREAIRLGREYIALMKDFLKDHAPDDAYKSFQRRLIKHWLFIYRTLFLQKVSEMRGR